LVALRPVRNALRRLSSDREGSVTVVLRPGASPAAVLGALETTGLAPTQVRVGGGSGDSLEVVAVYDNNDPSVLGMLAARVAGVDDVAEVFVGRV
jgi:hypothetical protein